MTFEFWESEKMIEPPLFGMVHVSACQQRSIAQVEAILLVKQVLHFFELRKETKETLIILSK